MEGIAITLGDGREYRLNVDATARRGWRRWLEGDYLVTAAAGRGASWAKDRDVAAILRLLWLGLRHNHPELTEARLAELVADPDVFKNAVAALGRFLPAEPRLTQAAKHKPRRRRRPRR